MEVRLATCAGHPGRPNEDFVGAGPGAIVLLDGAGIPDTESLCRHGVAWYAHTLGGWLLGRLSERADQTLAEVLADGIEAVTSLHRPTCDVADPSSPQATVAMLRADGDRIEHLVLGDAYIALGRSGPVEVVTDPAELAVRRQVTTPLDGLDPDSPEYAAALEDVIDQLRSRRNHEGGYWIAKDDPAAARHAVSGHASRADVAAALVLSNGVSRLVDAYAETTWSGLVDLAHRDGPDVVLRWVRAAETERTGEVPDDATLEGATWPGVS